jgi:hypothetical protein
MIGDALNSLQFFPNIIPNGIGDLDVFSDDVEGVTFVCKLIWLCHNSPVNWNDFNSKSLACQGNFHHNLFMSITTPGLLLEAVPYLGQKKILKIFTPELGLLSLFAQKTKLDPFCYCEWVYRKTEKEMHPLEDATLLDPLLQLRQDYRNLMAAGVIAKELLKTQMPGKRSPELFALALLYLRKLPSAPELYASSFRLKLLFHEGLLTEEPHPTFNSAEWNAVFTLAFSRKLAEIETVTSAPHAKIESFFSQRISE